ncbi:unnamed protein product [Caenorhabditis bovis]|uniref:Uncharacterized protein n=1 Tax=Caenorhabditis bovis TaxID=2654633 RepID=A0A8S1FCF1_9PELO|nr:unnamed protein product [Caenorhabditis bovis]
MAFISSDISSKSTKRDLISIWNGIEKLESSERTLLTIDDVAKEIRGDWKGRKCFVVDKSSYNGKPLTYDGLKWRKKIAPKYRQWNENGRVYGTIQCRSPSTASFRKTVVYMDDSTFVIVDYHRDEERISLDFDIHRMTEQWKVSNDDGFLFSGVTQLDTTFGLSELYVTLMCTTVKIFKSKKSKKPRTIVISYLLHSKKTMECHKFHANHVNEYLQKQGFKNDRVVPGFITDGEKSFEEYYKV